MNSDHRIHTLILTFLKSICQSHEEVWRRSGKDPGWFIFTVGKQFQMQASAMVVSSFAKAQFITHYYSMSYLSTLRIRFEAVCV